MDAGWAAILGAAVGSVGAGGVSIWTQVRERRDRDSDRRRALVEGAINAVSHERRLLHAAYSLWTNGVAPDDPRVDAVDLQVAEAIDLVWASGNLLSINFGSESRVALSFHELVAALDAVKMASLNRGGGGPSLPQESAWNAAQGRIIGAQRDFIETVRSAVSAA
jgi:hypothetical protein